MYWIVFTQMSVRMTHFQNSAPKKDKAIKPFFFFTLNDEPIIPEFESSMLTHIILIKRIGKKHKISVQQTIKPYNRDPYY